MNDNEFRPTAGHDDANSPDSSPAAVFEVRIPQSGPPRLIFPDASVFWKALDRARQKAADDLARATDLPKEKSAKASRRKPTNVVPPPILSDELPALLTPLQVAAYLRRTVGAVYVLASKPRPMGALRQGTRLFFRRDAFLRAVHGGTL